MPRPEIDALLRTLLARPESKLTLDHVAETIGASFIDVTEVDHVLEVLESRGRLADEGVLSASHSLSVTLTAARSLRLTLGRAPRPDEIAREAGVPLQVVRAGLFFAKILQRR